MRQLLCNQHIALPAGSDIYTYRAAVREQIMNQTMSKLRDVKTTKEAKELGRRAEELQIKWDDYEQAFMDLHGMKSIPVGDARYRRMLEFNREMTSLDFTAMKYGVDRDTIRAFFDARRVLVMTRLQLKGKKT